MYVFLSGFLSFCGGATLCLAPYYLTGKAAAWQKWLFNASTLCALIAMAVGIYGARRFAALLPSQPVTSDIWVMAAAFLSGIGVIGILALAASLVRGYFNFHP